MFSMRCVNSQILQNIKLTQMLGAVGRYFDWCTFILITMAKKMNQFYCRHERRISKPVEYLR